MTVCALVLFYIFLLLKPIYFFPSGGIGVGDVALVLCFAVLVARRLAKKDWKLWHKQDFYLYLTLAGVVLVNGIWYIRQPETEFLRNTLFWVYSAAVVWSFRELSGENGFFRGTSLALKAGLAFQLAVYVSGYGRIYYEYWDASRYMGTFNNPNQMAYVLFFMILLIYLYDRQHGKRSFWLWYALDGFLIGLTKSTGMFLGWGLLLAGVLVLELYGAYRNGKVSGKVIAGAAIVCAAALGIFLAVIWPEPGFVIQEAEYNIITRIQEKLALFSDGGLRKIIIDRGGEKLLYYPEYMLYGAGEGVFQRFPLAVVWSSEIHCTPFSMWFSYGVVPFTLWCIWIFQCVHRVDKKYWPVYVALLAESMTVINYRQPFFWLILVWGSALAEQDGRRHERKHAGTATIM